MLLELFFEFAILVKFCRPKQLVGLHVVDCQVDNLDSAAVMSFGNTHSILAVKLPPKRVRFTLQLSHYTNLL